MLTLSDLRDEAEHYIEREPTSGCWIWVGPYGGKGYSVLNRNGMKYYAHRLIYEADRGPIPPGLQIDHLCRVRCCVNPAHLEPVTARENLLRGETSTAREAAQTHCKRGHPFDAENTYRYRGHRYCRTCLRTFHNAQRRARYQGRKSDHSHMTRVREAARAYMRAYRRRRLARVLLEAV